MPNATTQQRRPTITSTGGSDVTARDRLPGDIAESEAGTDRRARADRPGADRARHGDAGAIKPADHALVGPQHLALAVGARPALGAEAGVDEGCGEERRLFYSLQCAIFGVVALPRRLAAMEVSIDAFLRPAIEALDRGLERRGVERYLGRQFLDRAGTAHEARILGGIHRRQAIGV